MAVDAKHQEILRQCCVRKTPVFFAADGVDVLFETLILSVMDDAVMLANNIPPDYITRTIASNRFSVQAQMVQLVSENIHSDGVNIVFPFRTLKAMEETRQTERVTFSPGEKVTVEMLNPVDQETVLTKSVIDLSDAGLSIRTSPHSRLYEPGLMFEDMKVYMNGKLKKKTSGRVVYQRLYLNQSGKRFRQVGFRFEK